MTLYASLLLCVHIQMFLLSEYITWVRLLYTRKDCRAAISVSFINHSKPFKTTNVECMLLQLHHLIIFGSALAWYLFCILWTYLPAGFTTEYYQLFVPKVKALCLYHVAICENQSSVTDVGTCRWQHLQSIGFARYYSHS